MDHTSNQETCMESAFRHWTQAIMEGRLPPNVLVWVWWLPMLEDPCGQCGTVMSVVGGPN